MRGLIIQSLGQDVDEDLAFESHNGLRLGPCSRIKELPHAERCLILEAVLEDL